MMRNILIGGAVALSLVACSNGNVNPIVKDAFGRVNPFGKEEKQNGSGAKPTVLTRAAIDKSGVAMIRASLLNEEGRFLFVAAAENAGHVTFATRSNQQITLRGSRVTGTRGLGFDLLASQTDGPDPLASPVPPANWPTEIRRVFTFPGVGPQGKKLVFDCTIERGKQTSVVIVQIKHQGVEFSETCRNDEMEFENLHMADVRSGFVWRSIQWIGPKMGNVDLEIIEPYTP